MEELLTWPNMDYGLVCDFWNINDSSFLFAICFQNAVTLC